MNFKKVLVYIFIMISGLILTQTVASATPAKPGIKPIGEKQSCRSHTRAGFVELSDIPEGEKNRKRIAVNAMNSAKKNLPTAVIVVGFNGSQTPVDYAADYDWGNRIFSGASSLAKYYSDMSFGQFSFGPVIEKSEFETNGNTNLYDRGNDGIIHVTVPQNHGDWTLDDEQKTYRSLSKVLTQALKKAEDYVDFKQYDADKDGIVENNEMALAFIMAGYEASSSNSFKEGRDKYTWAFMANMSDFRQYGITQPAIDDVGFSSFVTVGESGDESSGYDQAPFATLAHELGHYLGLPDLYDTSDSKFNSYRPWKNYQVDILSLMAGGAWGKDPEGNIVPYSFDVWSKYKLGWISPQRAEKSGIYNINYSNNNDANKTLRINTQQKDEYYLIENRQFRKWDEGMTNEGLNSKEGGLIVWHIDEGIVKNENENNGVNATYHRPGVIPLFGERRGRNKTMLGGSVNTKQVLFDNSFWNQYFKSYDGSELDLPLYGINLERDVPSERKRSGIKLEFLSESSEEMKVRFSDEEHIHYLKHHPEIASKCNKIGSIEYWHCEYCGKMFTDENGNSSITDDELSQKNNALGYGKHEWNNGKITKPATIESEGIKTFTCRVCGKTRTEEINKLANENERNIESGRTDKTYQKNGAALEKEIMSAVNDKDHAGAAYAALKFRSTKQGIHSISLKWEKTKGAVKYVLYANRCNSRTKKFRMVRIAQLTGTKYKVKRLPKALSSPNRNGTIATGKKLAKGKYYKFVMVALDRNGYVVSQSKTIHVATKGSRKAGNYSSINVKAKVNKNGKKLKKFHAISSLKTRKGNKIKLKAVAVSPKRAKVKKHVGIRFESSDTRIATVNKNGLITAHEKGKSVIYAFAQNGICKAVNININE